MSISSTNDTGLMIVLNVKKLVQLTCKQRQFNFPHPFTGKIILFLL